MKIHIFFEEDDDTSPTEFTDFKAESGVYDLLDLKKHFKNVSIDYDSPYRVRFMEALKILTAKNIDLDSKVIHDRFHPTLSK